MRQTHVTSHTSSFFIAATWLKLNEPSFFARASSFFTAAAWLKLNKPSFFARASSFFIAAAWLKLNEPSFFARASSFFIAAAWLKLNKPSFFAHASSFFVAAASVSMAATVPGFDVGTLGASPRAAGDGRLARTDGREGLRLGPTHAGPSRPAVGRHPDLQEAKATPGLPQPSFAPRTRTSQ
ncbi:MAG: hypothetical protein U1F26_15530 [Lysobacterales bacterium]